MPATKSANSKSKKQMQCMCRFLKIIRMPSYSDDELRSRAISLPDAHSFSPGVSGFSEEMNYSGMSEP